MKRVFIYILSLLIQKENGKGINIINPEIRAKADIYVLILIDAKWLIFEKSSQIYFNNV